MFITALLISVCIAAFVWLMVLISAMGKDRKFQQWVNRDAESKIIGLHMKDVNEELL